MRYPPLSQLYCHCSLPYSVRFKLNVGGFKNRSGQGKPRTSTDAAHVEEARRLLQENPRTTRRGGIVGRSVRSVARMLGIRRSSSHRILKDELGFYAYKDVERKKLTPMQRLQRILRGRNLRIRFANGRHRFVVISDESLFLIEQHHNAQNDRTRAKKGNPPPKDKRTVEKKMKPAGVMVWGAVGYNFKSKLQFVDKGVKINTQDYLRIMRRFKRDVKAHFGYTEEEGWLQHWTFQRHFLFMEWLVSVQCRAQKHKCLICGNQHRYMCDPKK